MNKNVIDDYAREVAETIKSGIAVPALPGHEITLARPLTIATG